MPGCRLHQMNWWRCRFPKRIDIVGVPTQYRRRPPGGLLVWRLHRLSRKLWKLLGCFRGVGIPSQPYLLMWLSWLLWVSEKMKNWNIVRLYVAWKVFWLLWLQSETCWATLGGAHVACWLWINFPNLGSACNNSIGYQAYNEMLIAVACCWWGSIVTKEILYPRVLNRQPPDLRLNFQPWNGVSHMTLLDLIISQYCGTCVIVLHPMQIVVAKLMTLLWCDQLCKVH